MDKKLKIIILSSIVLISLFMHFPHFSKELISFHSWRQTLTQSNIINFYEGDMDIFHPTRNDLLFSDGLDRMEFPLMQWMVAGLNRIFGYDLIITRISMFIIGLLTIFGMFRLLKAMFKNDTIAVIGSWAFNFSPSFYFYTINPLPDNMALCCSVWGLALFYVWRNNQKIICLILSGLMLSFGTLCKLPFGAFYVLPFVYYLMEIKKTGISKKLIINVFFIFIWFILPLMWYATVIPEWDYNPIMKGVTENKESTGVLLEYFQHILFSTMPELLINYGSVPFFIAGFYFVFKNKSHKKATFLPLFALSILLSAYYFFEMNAIAKVHDYYLFPFYPILFIIVSYGAYNMIKSGKRALKYISVFLLLILPLTCYLRMKDRWDPDSPGFNKDLLVYKTELRNAVPDDALVVAGNDVSHCIMFYYIDKKGWGFDNDNLTAETLKIFINDGARYLYTSSDEILQKEGISECVDSLIAQFGSVKIFRLR